MACLVLLSSCGVVVTNKVKKDLTGTTLPDLLACAGKPSNTMKIDDRDAEVTYTQATPVQPNFNIGGINGMSIGVGSMGTCNAIFRLRDGYVTSVHFTGPSGTFAGPESACVPLIDSCAYRSDHTTLPDNYDQFKILGIPE